MNGMRVRTFQRGDGCLDCPLPSCTAHRTDLCGRTLRQGMTGFAVLRAVFPGSSITGCPKVHAMQVVRAREQAPRCSHTGGVGCVSRAGCFACIIPMRRFLLRGRVVRLHAEAGLGRDPAAPRELDETRTKARHLLRAMEIA
jgi:4-amino-4-deoxychorismate synthase (2-amino-4-deoxychorismate-forming) component I